METGIFVRMTRTLGGFNREIFVLSENLAKGEIEREVAEYLKEPSDTFIHGDLHIEEEKCNIWKPSKPLRDKVNILLAEAWSGSGTCWAFACRNEAEIKEALRHAISHEDFDKMGAKIYRGVPVLKVIPNEKRRESVDVDVRTKIQALARGLE